MKYGLSEEIYNKIKNITNKNNKYKFILFGSRARGDYKNTSDIDIAVIKNVSDIDRYKIMNEIDLLDIIYKIDLVFINEHIKPKFLDEINKEGVEI